MTTPKMHRNQNYTGLDLHATYVEFCSNSTLCARVYACGSVGAWVRGCVRACASVCACMRVCVRARVYMCVRVWCECVYVCVGRLVGVYG